MAEWSIAVLLIGTAGILPARADELARYVVFASHGVSLRQGAVVRSGDVGVREAGEGPWLEEYRELTVSHDVRMADGTRLEADSVNIKAGASVFEVRYNELDNRGQIRGSQTTPLPLPLQVDLPTMPAPMPGSRDYEVSRGNTLTLPAGRYGAVRVRSNAALVLAGGTYHFQNLDLAGNDAKVLFEAPAELVIANRIESGRNSIVGPAEDSGVKAHDIRIYVGGRDGTAIDSEESPKAVVIGQSSTVKANIYAPKGTLWIRRDARAEGAFIGRDVRIDADTNVSLDSAFRAAKQYSYFRDADGDGYGDKDESLTSSSAFPPAGYVLNATDCDDAAAAVNPGSAEACNGLDDNCDGQIDEGCPSVTYYRDADGDGYGDSSVLLVTTLAAPPPGFVSVGGDCDDARSAVHPGAEESCNGIDDDCDGQLDEGVTTTYYPDADGDGYGADLPTVQACVLPQGYASVGGDCNDAQPAVAPGRPEVCDLLDNDCDGRVDQSCPVLTYYADADGDGYGNAAAPRTTTLPTPPPGYVADASDCRDADGSVHPGAAENCDGKDNDCDGLVDERCDAAPLPEGSFGKPYETLIPDDATIQAFDASRFSVVTGFVRGRDGSPVEDVKVTVHGQPAYGSAWTDAQGRFFLPVEGGASFTLGYVKPGLLTGHRQVYVPWNELVVADPVTMIEADSLATVLTFDGNAGTVLVHRSSPVVDEFGSRSATLVFSGDNRAWVKDSEGNERAARSVTVRATEFDVPEAMPAKLPPTSAYTYCTELAVDEGESVRFEKPVTVWVDDFLGFPVGAVVPAGYYDRDQAVWIASENGTVVKLLDRDGDGLVDALDQTGDGLPDDVNGDGSFSDEVAGLDAAGHRPHATLWRVKVTHFTPWDFNWPFGPPPNAVPPNFLGLPTSHPPGAAPLPGQGAVCTVTNSYTTPLDGVFHEEIPVPGTGMALHYSSGRVPGRKTLISIPASGETVPAELKAIQVFAFVAGHRFEASLPAAPNQRAEFVWDGMDATGGPVVGSAMAKARIGFVYNGYYSTPRSDVQRAFAQTGSQTTAVRAREEITLWQDAVLTVPSPFQGGGTLAEGWTLTPHHQSAPGSPLLFKGDGSLAQQIPQGLIQTVAGNGSMGYLGDGGPATQARLSWAEGVAVDKTGSLYVADTVNHRIRKVDTAGVITTVAGTGTAGFNGDGIPAAQATLNSPAGVALDASGNLYIADQWNSRVRKVGVGGIISTVAGTGVRDYGGDGGPATAAQINMPAGVMVDGVGNLYVADSYDNRIRKVDTTGVITTVAGLGWMNWGFAGDGGPAVKAKLNGPQGLALDQSGNLYIADSGNGCVRRIDPSGTISTVAGRGTSTYGEGVPAKTAYMSSPRGLVVDQAGNLYVSEYSLFRVRRVDPTGLIYTVAGIPGKQGYNGEAVLPTNARLFYPWALALDGRANLYVADQSRIRKIVTPEGVSSLAGGPGRVFSEEGVSHVLDLGGRHQATVDLASGRPLVAFGYEADGGLADVTFAPGRTTSILRDGAGRPMAIVSPDGLVTGLSVDGSRHLRRVLYPDGSRYDFSYTPDGLLTEEWDPNGNHFTHGYDALGALTDVFDPEGGRWTYSLEIDPAGITYTDEETGERNVTSYQEVTDLTGSQTLAVTSPFGSVSTRTRPRDGLSSVTRTACGMKLEQSYGIDPVFKDPVVTGSTTTLPSGLKQVATNSRASLDTDADGVPDRITETAAVNGKARTAESDTLLGVVTNTSAAGRSSTLTYDTTSLLPHQYVIPGFYPVSFGYDAGGRLEALTVGLRATTVAYDANGNPDYLVAADGKVIDYSYDVMGRLRGEVRPGGNSIRYEYDPNGNLELLVTPTGASHAFGYSGNDQRRAYATPLSGSYTYTYDKERNLRTATAPSGRVITNSYLNGLLDHTDTPEGRVTFGHDCGGRIATATKGAEGISYAFDGPLLVRDTRTGLVNQVLAYGYNNDFLPVSMTYADSTEALGYDLDGLLTWAGGFTIARNTQNGRPESISDGALVLGRAFNGYGEMDGSTYTLLGSARFSWAVTQRDGGGRIKQKVETLVGETSAWDYAYDDLGRLTEVKKNGAVVESYSYDANGNRAAETNALRGVSRTYVYSGEDHLLMAGSDTYAFDLDGFLAARETVQGTTRYQYSSRGELLQVSLPDGTVVTYDHDPLGRRIAKRINGAVAEKYLWAGPNMGLLAVYDGSDNLVMRFRYADDRVPVSLTYQGQVYYLLTDQVGTVRAIVNASGEVVKRLEYDAFGAVVSDSNPAFPMPLGFAGGMHDRDVGLVRFGARDYHPETGRWAAKDPIDFAGGDANLYGYVFADPGNLADPNGQIAPILLIGGAVLGGGANAIANWNAYKSGAISGSAYISSIVFGAGTGALAAFAPGLWSGAVLGGLTGAANTAFNQSLNPCSRVGWQQPAQGFLWGVISSFPGAIGAQIGTQIIPFGSASYFTKGAQFPLAPVPTYGAVGATIGNAVGSVIGSK